MNGYSCAIFASSFSSRCCSRFCLSSRLPLLLCISLISLNLCTIKVLRMVLTNISRKKPIQCIRKVERACKMYYLPMIVVIWAQVTLKFMSQLVLLIAKAAKEHLLYLLDFTADFVLTLCYDLDCHDLHQAGKRNHQIKSVRNAQDSNGWY